MATKKLQVLANLGPTDAKIKSAVEEHFVDHPIDSTLIDKLCPAFTESGSVVTCQPVEGYPLQAVSHIAVVRDGEGTASPDNIRPFAMHTEVQLIQSNESDQLTFATGLGQEIYGGSFDWATGVLSVEYAAKVFDGTTNYGMFVSSDGTGKNYAYTSRYPSNALKPKAKGKIYANKATYVSLAGSRGDNIVVTIPGTYTGVTDTDSEETVVEKFNALAKTWYDAGEPLIVVYERATPATVQLTPQEIRALSGVNTIYSDTGDTTITGRADPNYVIDTLLDRVAALEAAAVNNT